MRSALFIASITLATACAPHQAPVVFDLRPAPSAPSAEAGSEAELSYAPVSGRAASILGCDLAPESPVCSIALPTTEEDSAFRAEADRLALHVDARCRKLGAAIDVNEPGVRMYRKALVRPTAGEQLYGVGHAYAIDNVWQVRIARRIDELNERTLEEKTRTLRHEMSHTIGATETPGFGWTAEDYAERCG